MCSSRCVQVTRCPPNLMKFPTPCQIFGANIERRSDQLGVCACKFFRTRAYFVCTFSHLAPKFLEKAGLSIRNAVYLVSNSLPLRIRYRQKRIRDRPFVISYEANVIRDCPFVIRYGPERIRDCPFAIRCGPKRVRNGPFGILYESTVIRDRPFGICYGPERIHDHPFAIRYDPKRIRAAPNRID